MNDSPSRCERNALTVDVEDYFHVSALSKSISRSDWHNMEYRVDRNTGKLLELFAEFDIKATFFVLGWVAEHHEYRDQGECSGPCETSEMRGSTDPPWSRIVVRRHGTERSRVLRERQGGRPQTAVAHVTAAWIKSGNSCRSGSRHEPRSREPATASLPLSAGGSMRVRSGR